MSLAALRAVLDDPSWPEKAFEELHKRFSFAYRIAGGGEPGGKVSNDVIDMEGSLPHLSELAEGISAELGEMNIASCFVLSAATAGYIEERLGDFCDKAAQLGLRQSSVEEIVRLEGDRIALSALLLELVRDQTENGKSEALKSGCLAALRCSHVLIEDFTAFCCKLQAEESESLLPLPETFHEIADIMKIHREMVDIMPLGRFASEELSLYLGIH